MGFDLRIITQPAKKNPGWVMGYQPWSWTNTKLGLAINELS